MTSGGSSLQYLGEHGPMASAVARAYILGLEAEPPAGYRGRAPGQGWGEVPLKLKHFSFWMINRSCKFAHFSKIC